MSTKTQRSNHAGVLTVIGLFMLFPLATTPLPTDSVMPLRLLLMGLVMATGLWAIPNGRTPQPIILALGVAAAVFIVSALASSAPAASLLGRYPRYEGLPMIAAYGGFIVVGSRLLGGENLRRTALTAFSLSATVQAVVSLGQVLVAPTQRVTGLVGNSTTLGIVSILGLTMLGAAVSERRTGHLAVGFVASSICLTLSASRGALLGAAAAAVVASLLLLRQGCRRWWSPFAVAALLVVAMLILPTGRARLTGSSPFSEATITGRQLLWHESWSLFLSHPILGVGPSRFVDSIGAFHTPAWAAAVGPYAPPDSPHMVVLQVLAATGGIGLLALLGLGALILRPLIVCAAPSSWQVGALAGACGVGVAYLTAFTDPLTTSLTAAILGGAVSTTGGVVRRAWDRTAAAVALVIGGYFGVSLLVAEATFSAGLVQGSPRTVVEATTVRPWDLDLTYRAGYTIVRLAEKGRADPRVAVTLLKPVCPRMPGSVECLAAYADALDLAGDHSAALRQLDQALVLDAVNVDLHLRRGIALAQSGRLEEAERAFKRGAELRPTAPEPWSNLATLYRSQGRAVEAEEAAATAKRLSKR